MAAASPAVVSAPRAQTAQAPEAAPDSASAPEASGARPGAVVVGTVREPETGQLLVGANVIARAPGGARGFIAGAATDAEGRYHLDLTAYRDSTGAREVEVVYGFVGFADRVVTVDLLRPRQRQDVVLGAAEIIEFYVTAPEPPRSFGPATWFRNLKRFFGL